MEVKSIFKKLCWVFLAATLAWALMITYGERIVVTDPDICKNADTLAYETAKRVNSGDLAWYQVLHCQDMGRGYGFSLSKGDK